MGHMKQPFQKLYCTVNVKMICEIDSSKSAGIHCQPNFLEEKMSDQLHYGTSFMSLGIIRSVKRPRLRTVILPKRKTRLNKMSLAKVRLNILW